MAATARTEKQGDLFGAPTQPAYVVPYDIAVNTLKKMAPKLMAALPPGEAEHWRRLIEAETARLDAA